MRRKLCFLLGLTLSFAGLPAFAAAPFGFLEGIHGTQNQNAGGGLLPITGWALDDDGVERVEFYVDGAIVYGSAKKEFDDSHGKTDELENGYFKDTPISAYQYHGPTARVQTVLADGTVETGNTISDGDWLVKWPAGEVGVLKDDNFRKRYQVN